MWCRNPSDGRQHLDNTFAALRATVLGVWPDDQPAKVVQRSQVEV
jgi:hypothetical protein